MARTQSPSRSSSATRQVASGQSTKQPAHSIVSAHQPQSRASNPKINNGVSNSQSARGGSAHLYTFAETKCKSGSINSDEMAFESGAWLFDMSAAPQWMAPLIPSVQTKTKNSPSAASSHAPKSTLLSQSTIKSTSAIAAMPSKQQGQKAHVYTLAETHLRQSNKNDDDEDVAFNSGAWLFDSSSAPQWLSPLVQHRPLNVKAAPFSMKPASPQHTPIQGRKQMQPQHQQMPMLAKKQQQQMQSPSKPQQQPAHVYSLAETRCRKLTNEDMDAYVNGSWLFETPSKSFASTPSIKMNNTANCSVRPKSSAAVSSSSSSPSTNGKKPSAARRPMSSSVRK